MSGNNLFSRSVSVLCLAGLTFGAAAENQPMEEVTVTGSYIKGSAEDAPSPVQVLQREDIVISGVSDASELIRNLEIQSGSDTAPADGARFNGQAGNGLANISLRGLGPTATLVLLDGKRMPYAGQKLADGDRFVDINTIPFTMVQRLEILKDGGSAIYGSDAIAGVVNFITRSDFEGFEINVKHLTVDQGNSDDNTVGAIFGWSNEERTANFVIGGEYFDRTKLRSSERRDLRQDLYDKQDGTIVNRSSAFVPIPGLRDFAGDPQCESLGYFRDNDLSTDPFICQRPGAETGIMIPESERASVMATGSFLFSESAELYGQLSWMDAQNGQPEPVHVGPLEPKFFFPTLIGSLSTSVFTTGTVPWASIDANGDGFPDTINPFADGAPGDPSVIANGGPLPAAPIPGVALPLDLVDFELRSTGVEPDRLYETGNESETIRYQVGLRGDLPFGDGSWTYDLSYTHGENEFARHFLGIDKNRLELALYGLGGPNCTPNGSIAAGDPRADTGRFLLAGADGVFDPDGAQGPLEPLMLAVQGTVPDYSFINADNLLLAMTSDNMGTGGCGFYNPYLTRANALPNDTAMLEWLEVDMQNAQVTETHITTADFVMSGNLFSWNGRDVAAAFGLQYREEGRKTTVHPQTLGFENSFGQNIGAETVAGLSENRNFDSQRDINAFFVEFQVPITENIDMQLAGRYEDYGGDIGDTFDPKIGIRWQATNGLVIRGSASSSFRGPSLAQVEEGTGYSLEFGVADILGERGAGDPVAAMNGPNCVRTGQCAAPSATGAPLITIVKRGQRSPTLSPEEAVTFNFGMQWTIQGGPLENLLMGFDYYNIELEQKIIDVPTQSFLSTEAGLFNTAQAANDYVIVEPTAGDFGQACDPTAAEFQFATGGSRAEQCQVNPNSYALEGITRRTDLSRDLQIIEGPSINTGRVETDGVDFNFALPFSAGDAGSFLLTGTFNYILNFDVSDFPVGQPDFQAAGFTNRDPNKRLARSMPDFKGNVGLGWGLGNHAANAMVRYIGSYVDNAPAQARLEDEFDPYYAVDLRYAYNWQMGDNGTLTLALGGIDVFDADLPNVRDSRGVDLSVFDQRGRRWYLSLGYSM